MAPPQEREAMPVDAVTLRRWVEAPAREVWRRLVDVDGLLADDPGLDILELIGDEDRFGPGSVAVLRRRRGPRVSTLEVEVVEATPPERLSLCITHGSARWSVVAELEPLGSGTTDVALHARRDPCPGTGRLLRAATGRADDHRLAVDLVRTLERIIERVDRPVEDGVSVVETHLGESSARAGQRIAPGR